MKRINIRTIIWSLLIIASLSAYIYLNLISISSEETYSKSMTKQESIEQQDEESNSSVITPEVALIAKILNVTKIALPGE
jgi:hypothetical protein